MGSKWITLIGLTMFTVVMWIAIEVTITLLAPDIEDNYDEYISPLPLSLSTDILDDLEQKEDEYILVKPGELD